MCHAHRSLCLAIRHPFSHLLLSCSANHHSLLTHTLTPSLNALAARSWAPARPNPLLPLCCSLGQVLSARKQSNRASPFLSALCTCVHSWAPALRTRCTPRGPTCARAPCVPGCLSCPSRCSTPSLPSHSWRTACSLTGAHRYRVRDFGPCPETVLGHVYCGVRCGKDLLVEQGGDIIEVSQLADRPFPDRRAVGYEAGREDKACGTRSRGGARCRHRRSLVSCQTACCQAGV